MRRANGIAGLQSNTVLVGWPQKPGRLEAWLRIMRALSRVEKSTQDPPPSSEAEYARRLEELAEGLYTTVFARNAGRFVGKLV